MELTQLNYFRHVALTDNMSRSASELHISQPALSKMIDKLGLAEQDSFHLHPT